MASSSSNRCSLNHCLQHTAHISTTHPSIEVSTVIPAKLNKTERNKFLVDWSKNGEAKFHVDCWEALLKSARARRLGNAKHTVNLKIATEKAMVKEAEKTAERHDGKDFVDSEAGRIADMIKSSKHCVVFTGAGISTSAGIGDYRGRSGKWTQQDRAEVCVTANDAAAAKIARLDADLDDSEKDSSEDEEEVDGVAYEKLRPTYTHEAIRHLLDLGYIKYVISQNGDGLHTLSGIPQAQISELHGNVFQERCERCSHVYDRDAYVLDDISSQYYEELEDNGHTDVIKPSHAAKCTLCGLNHRTGRKCTQKGCRGYLKDTIINFRDNLDEDILRRATDEAKQSDVMICLGTTLRVTPACDLVEMGHKPLCLIICNRQKTALDGLCTEKRADGQSRGSRVFGDCDLLMREVMKCILSKAALQKWEAGREKQLQKYDKLRQS